MTLPDLLLVKCDSPEPWRMGMQDPASPVAEGLTELHDVIMYYILIIGVGVTWVMMSQVSAFTITKSPISHRYYNHGTATVGQTCLH